MKTFWKNLFEYSHHCNQGLFKLFAENTDRASEKSVRLFNHIINAHQIWNGRIEGIPQAAGVWGVRPAGDLKDLDAANFRNTLEILYKINLSYITRRARVRLLAIQSAIFSFTQSITLLITAGKLPWSSDKRELSRGARIIFSTKERSNNFRCPRCLAFSIHLLF